MTGALGQPPLGGDAAAHLALRVTRFGAEAKDVVSLELRDPSGAALPRFEPGAHLEIALPAETSGGRPLLRHYSLCNDPAETDRYVIAVGRVADGRGGSRVVHDAVRVGSTLAVRAPRNHFPLTDDASHYRFVAGGIGITPILAMLRWCRARGKSWSVFYAARSRQRAAFYDTLSTWGDAVRFHFDDEAGGPADVAAALGAARPGEQVYCCGPAPLMRAVEAHCRAQARPARFEWFGGDAAPVARDGADATHDANAARPPAVGDAPFTVVLRRSGLTLDVPADRSILETLEAHGLEVPHACREGLCRSCETRLCAGEADHRDQCLSDAERASQSTMLICVSRARGRMLELDA